MTKLHAALMRRVPLILVMDSTLAPEKRGEGPEDPPEGNPTAKIRTVSTPYFRFLRVLNRQAASILSIKGDLGKFFDREST